MTAWMLRNYFLQACRMACVVRYEHDHCSGGVHRANSPTLVPLYFMLIAIIENLAWPLSVPLAETTDIKGFHSVSGQPELLLAERLSACLWYMYLLLSCVWMQSKLRFRPWQNACLLSRKTHWYAASTKSASSAIPPCVVLWGWDEFHERRSEKYAHAA